MYRGGGKERRQKVKNISVTFLNQPIKGKKVEYIPIIGGKSKQSEVEEVSTLGNVYVVRTLNNVTLMGNVITK